MKRFTVFFSLILFVLSSYAQDKYVFTDVIKLPTTSVKNQYASGTCWAFSTISFIESEIARLGTPIDKVPDISEMFVVRKVYELKAQKYIRMHGTVNFGGGGAFEDVFTVYEQFGMMPEETYTGLNYGKDKHNHSELDKVCKAYVDALKDESSLSTAWLAGFNGILNAYLGVVPETFKYKSSDYTPITFAEKYCKINPNDYISITSYTHHPFYSTFAIEVQDNWNWGLSYNVPMEDMLKIADNALKNKFSIAWGADVSEVYFSHADGVAIVPDLDIEELVRTERSRWEKVDKDKYNLNKPGKEKVITQEMRQVAFDNYQTTDDHGLHIIGLAKDQNNNEYFIVKNSWNTDNPYGGYLYVSKAFFLYKTMNYVVHKDAIPSDIKAKLGIK